MLGHAEAMFIQLALAGFVLYIGIATLRGH